MSTVDFNDQGNCVTMQKQQARRKRVSLKPRQQLAFNEQFASDDFHLI
jgi:hypothetical protein